MLQQIRRRFGSVLARYLSQPRGLQASIADPAAAHRLIETLRPGDVLLVEGNTRIATGIKYLTQSTWSHAALYVGRWPTPSETYLGESWLIEADVADGVIAVPVGKYSALRTRICRPIGLTDSDRARVVEQVVARVGQSYDLRNVWDLARYLIATPPVPVRWRRRMLALGSGDPTRAICSTLIAEAFQSVRYPILPELHRVPSGRCEDCDDDVLHLRHHSLFAPRDFDISPYFAIVKPDLVDGFDYRRLRWSDRVPAFPADADRFVQARE